MRNVTNRSLELEVRDLGVHCHGFGGQDLRFRIVGIEDWRQSFRAFMRGRRGAGFTAAANISGSCCVVLSSVPYMPVVKMILVDPLRDLWRIPTVVQHAGRFLEFPISQSLKPVWLSDAWRASYFQDAGLWDATVPARISAAKGGEKKSCPEHAHQPASLDANGCFFLRSPGHYAAYTCPGRPLGIYTRSTPLTRWGFRMSGHPFHWRFTFWTQKPCEATSINT